MRIDTPSTRSPCLELLHAPPDGQKPNQESFLRKTLRQAKESFLRWYPPLMVLGNPTLRRALSTFLPPLGKALDGMDLFCAAGKDRWEEMKKGR